ncbi:LysR substrate-binding domain-containing protein [Vibrio sp. TRT 21S02]|uniref:LysR substrate-binding domain-containing protein n=1 Tax=unclassified Vibrio TaxID=2614977 RepID=UPI003CEA4884
MAKQQSLLRNLHTFNVASRTLSFTLAAKELHLTQGAVSHRIKVLESELGFNLFVRGIRKLELTEEGKRFQATLSSSLNKIFTEINDIKSLDEGGELNIATSLGFANGWLLPKLADFKAQYPKFNLNIFAQENNQDLVGNNVDVAIFYASEHHANMHRKRLLNEKYIPVCSPQYAEELGLYKKGLESLHEVNFIHALGSEVWQQWVEHMKLKVDVFKHSYSVSYREMGITCARNHLGVAMGRYQFVKPLIESGELVSPYPYMDTELGYDVMYPVGADGRPKVKVFINWLEEQLS